MIVDIILVYGFISLSHLFVQIAFGNAESLKVKLYNHNYMPGLAIVIPEYNESKEFFTRCIESCLAQDYKGKLKIFAIDDGSKSKDAIEHIELTYGNRVNVIRLDNNVGKRKAQKSAFDLLDTDVDIIITLDSDTILEKDAVRKLARHFNDERVGSVTGDAYVYKRNTNLLTKLISSRYWIAFNQERSAQSLFGTVLCATGVISAYRATLINRLKDRYVHQTFMNDECTYGDDRHLTNLVLDSGYKVIFEPEAIGWTDTPKNMKAYLKQQLRWNRSFYREMFITLKMLIKNPRRYPLYTIYDLSMQALLPLLLLCGMVYMVYNIIGGNYQYVVAFIGTLIGVSFIRSVYAMTRTADNNFLLFPLYSFIHIFLLIPLRIYALFTLSAKGWGTR